MIKRIKAGRMNLDFCLLLGVLVLVNLFYFRPGFIPIGDTLHAFSQFFFFYNEFFYHHHLAQWMPQSSFGVPSLLTQMGNITPLRLMAGFIGTLLKVHNVLFVWKITILLEQMVFLLGLYWLARLLYSCRSTVFFVCLGGITSIFWWEQSFFDLHLFYLVPLLLYWFIAFLKEGRGECFWLGCITGVFALIGVMPYIVGLWFFILSVLMAVMSWRCRAAWKKVFSFRLPLLALAVFFVLISILYVYAVKSGSYGADLQSTGRDPHTGKCLLENFLNHGGVASPREVFRAFVSGDVRHKIGDVGNLSYIGLLPWVFFVWAVMKARGPVYYALLVITAALTALSFGGMVARTLYYFPLMAYYRHLGYLYGLIKVFVLLCAGIGWEKFFENLTGKNRALGIAAVSVIFSGLVLCKAFVFPVWALSLAGVFAVGMAGWWFYGKTGKENLQGAFFAGVLMAVFALDMGFYQAWLYKNSIIVSAKDHRYLESVRVHPQEYQPQRTFVVPQGGRPELAMGLLNVPEEVTRTYYSWDNAFVQYETCIPEWPMQMSSPEVGRLNSMNPVLLAVAGGCYEPKLRLFASSEYISEEEERALFLRTDSVLKKMVGSDRNKVFGAMAFVQQGLKDNIFIRRESGAAVPPLLQERLSSDAVGHVSVRKYSTDEIVADVDVQKPQGAWLFYAEAFHPDWHALVDGKKTKVFHANLAFKALFLPGGKHRVRLFFDQGPIAAARSLLAVLGACAGLVCCVLIVKECFGIPFQTSQHGIALSPAAPSKGF